MLLCFFLLRIFRSLFLLLFFIEIVLLFPLNAMNEIYLKKVSDCVRKRTDITAREMRNINAALTCLSGRLLDLEKVNCTLSKSLARYLDKKQQRLNDKARKNFINMADMMQADLDSESRCLDSILCCGYEFERSAIESWERAVALTEPGAISYEYASVVLSHLMNLRALTLQTMTADITSAYNCITVLYTKNTAFYKQINSCYIQHLRFKAQKSGK